MAMGWMPMCGQTWAGAAATFTGMWIVMMTAMMLPSLVPMLSRYRRSVELVGWRADVLTLLVGLAYFSVWTAIGMAVFPLGAAVAAAELRLQYGSH